MIFRLVGLLKALSRPHYLMIVVTIILPVAVTSFIAYGFSCLVVGLVGGWSLTVLVSVAWMLNHDKSVAERNVDWKLEGLSKEVGTLRDDQTNATADLQDQVSETNRVMRSGFEELGLVLPPRRISLRASLTSGPATFSASGIGRSPNKLVRWCRWVRRRVRRLSQIVIG